MAEAYREDFEKPEPINIPKRQIFSFAEAASKKLGLNPGESIEPIVSALGGKIDFLNIDDWVEEKSGTLEVYKDSKFTIYISSFTGPLRNRFTIAHELGHYFLHARAGKKSIRVERRAGCSDRLEWEANWFAAGFLMPESQFREMVVSYDRDIDRIAAHFQVSNQAAATRMKDLGL